MKVYIGIEDGEDIIATKSFVGLLHLAGEGAGREIESFKVTNWHTGKTNEGKSGTRPVAGVIYAIDRETDCASEIKFESVDVQED